MVPEAGLEPASLAAVDFESTASTNSATRAHADDVIKPNKVTRQSANAWSCLTQTKGHDGKEPTYNPGQEMIRGLYNWTMSLAESRHALWALALVSFAESSFFPIPPDILMIPMILAAPRRAFLIAAIAMVASVLGGLFGYFIGSQLFESVGRPVLDFYGKTEAAEAFNQKFNAMGAWAVLVAGVTPFPFKVITIMSGWTGLSLPVFILSAIIARGARFFIVAALLWKFGAPIREFIERRLGLMFTIFVILLIGGFYAVKYL